MKKVLAILIAAVFCATFSVSALAGAPAAPGEAPAGESVEAPGAGESEGGPAGPGESAEGESGGDTTGGSDNSEEEYEWFIKQGNDWISLPESDSPLTLFLAKQALSMSKNMTEDISFQIKPDLTLEGVKLNVTAVGTMTKGDTDNSADLLFVLSDATTADSTEGNYRIKAYFTNVGGDSFFHWKLYDMESIRKSTETAVSSGSDGEETP